MLEQALNEEIIYSFNDDDDADFSDFPGLYGIDNQEIADKQLCHTHNPFIYCPSCLCTFFIKYRIHELPKSKEQRRSAPKYAQNYKCKNEYCGNEIVFYSFMEQQEKMEYVYELNQKYEMSNRLISKQLRISEPTVATYLAEYEKLISIKWRIIEKSGLTEGQYLNTFAEENITAGASNIADTLLANIKIAATLCGVKEHEVFGWINENKEARNKRMLALAYHIQDKYRMQTAI